MPQKDQTGPGRSTTAVRVGIDLLHDPLLNKGTAFTEHERNSFGLRGLLPPRVDTMQEQLMRTLENYHAKPSDLEKFIYRDAMFEPTYRDLL